MTARSGTPFSTAIAVSALLAFAAVVLGAAVMVLSASPLALARAVLPATAPLGRPSPQDRMLAAAATGGLGRHIRLAGLAAGEGAKLHGSHRRIAIGDRISIAGHDGAKRDYAVITINEIEVPVSEVDDHGPPSRLLLVVAHDVAVPGARPLRFIVESDREVAPPAAPAHQQAL